MTIHIVLVIIIILKLYTKLLDIKGAFLQGEFESNEKLIYMKVLQGLE